MKIGVVVLSRFNSNRLPGKALLKIGNKRVLEYIIERLMQVVPISLIVIATSEEKTDEPIAEFCEEYGIRCFRGSLKNVAERFIKAAQSQEWDYAVRINGDNIFVDTKVLSQMLQLAKTDHYQFLSNVKGRTFPKGMSIEIVKVNFFVDLLPSINLSVDYQEHVTLILYQMDNPASYFLQNLEVPEAAGIQMALDTQEDFERSKLIIRHFTREHWLYNLKEIYEIWRVAKFDTV